LILLLLLAQALRRHILLLKLRQEGYVVLGCPLWIHAAFLIRRVLLSIRAYSAIFLIRRVLLGSRCVQLLPRHLMRQLRA
jgi:hypothetical protein